MKLINFSKSSLCIISKAVQLLLFATQSYAYVHFEFQTLYKQLQKERIELNLHKKTS